MWKKLNCRQNLWNNHCYSRLHLSHLVATDLSPDAHLQSTGWESNTILCNPWVNIAAKTFKNNVQLYKTIVDKLYPHKGHHRKCMEIPPPSASPLSCTPFVCLSISMSTRDLISSCFLKRQWYLITVWWMHGNTFLFPSFDLEINCGPSLLLGVNERILYPAVMWEHCFQKGCSGSQMCFPSDFPGLIWLCCNCGLASNIHILQNV